MTYDIKLGLTYENTDFNREVIITDVSETDAAIETVRAKVDAVNASLSGGTSDGLNQFFRADDGSYLKHVSCEIQNVDVVDII